MVTFFDSSLDNDLKKLLDQGKIDGDEKMVVNYHLSGLSDSLIRLISGKSYEQFLRIEQNVLDAIARMKARTGGASQQEPIERNPVNITLQTCKLTNEELTVIESFLQDPPLALSAIAKILSDKFGKTFSQTKIKELEKSALDKLQHPIFKLQKKAARTSATAQPKPKPAAKPKA